MNNDVKLGLNLFFVGTIMIALLLFNIYIFTIVSSIGLLVLYNFTTLLKDTSEQKKRIKTFITNFCLIAIIIYSFTQINFTQNATILNQNNSQRTITYYHYNNNDNSEESTSKYYQYFPLSHDYYEKEDIFAKEGYNSLIFMGFQTDLNTSSIEKNNCEIVINIENQNRMYEEKQYDTYCNIRLIYLNNYVEDMLGSNQLVGYGIWITLDNLGEYGDNTIKKENEGIYGYYEEFSFNTKSNSENWKINLDNMWQGKYLLAIEYGIVLPINDIDLPEFQIYSDLPYSIEDSVDIKITTNLNNGYISQGYVWQNVDLEFSQGAGDFFTDLAGKRNLVVIGIFFTLYLIALIISLIKGNSYIINFFLMILGVFLMISAISEFAFISVSNPIPKWAKILFKESAEWIWTLFAILRTILVYGFFYEILKYITGFYELIQERISSMMEKD